MTVWYEIDRPAPQFWHGLKCLARATRSVTCSPKAACGHPIMLWYLLPVRVIKTICSGSGTRAAAAADGSGRLPCHTEFGEGTPVGQRVGEAGFNLGGVPDLPPCNRRRSLSPKLASCTSAAAELELAAAAASLRA